MAENVVQQNSTQTSAAAESADGKPQSASASAPQAAGKSVDGINYEKLAEIVAGKQTVTEETVLKGYFKQQGLTGDEMTAAIAAYKQQKAAKTPDIGNLQNQIAGMQRQITKAALEQAATIEAVKLGIAAEAVPYVLRMVDLDNAAKEGKPDAEAIRKALQAVLDAFSEVPGFFRPGIASAAKPTSGFVLGAPAESRTGGESAKTNRTTPVSTKRWNRFNN